MVLISVSFSFLVVSFLNKTVICTIDSQSRIYSISWGTNVQQKQNQNKNLVQKLHRNRSIYWNFVINSIRVCIFGLLNENKKKHYFFDNFSTVKVDYYNALVINRMWNFFLDSNDCHGIRLFVCKSECFLNFRSRDVDQTKIKINNRENDNFCVCLFVICFGLLTV